jgi:hypothetical protein
MVGVVALSREGSNSATRTVEQVTAQYQALTASESLGSTRLRITAVDICYGKSKKLFNFFFIQVFYIKPKNVENKL